jgi:hypothetical protein
VEAENSPRLIPIDEARRQLGGIGHSKAYELIKAGELMKVNVGRRAFITAESLVAYVNRITEAATA